MFYIIIITDVFLTCRELPAMDVTLHVSSIHFFAYCSTAFPYTMRPSSLIYNTYFTKYEEGQQFSHLACMYWIYLCLNPCYESPEVIQVIPQAVNMMLYKNYFIHTPWTDFQIVLRIISTSLTTKQLALLSSFMYISYFHFRPYTPIAFHFTHHPKHPLLSTRFCLFRTHTPLPLTILT